MFKQTAQKFKDTSLLF